MSKQTAASFAFDVTKTRYGIAPRIKMNKKLFQGDIESAWIAGYLSALEEIRIKHNEEHYRDVDEILGDTHIMSKKVFNKFNTKLAGGKLRPVQIEDFTREHPTQDKWIGESYGQQ